jgi:hypothetical protein
MSAHISISSAEAADRLAIRELADAYAFCADTRNAKGQMALFTKDTHFVVFMDEKSSKPTMELNRREDLAPVFADLNQYESTMHFNGQSTVIVNGDRATGELYCIAHHVKVTEGKRTLFLAYIRYFDTFSKIDGNWLFAGRKLMVAWTETRPLNA